MDSFFIFIAEYLYLIPPVVAGIYFLKQSRTVQKKMFVFALIVLPLIGIVAFLGNHIFNDPRPFVTDSFTPLIPHTPDNGFPSDHTLLVSAITVVIYGFNRRLGMVLGLAVALVAISRVYVGLHHPIDVIGSILISVFVAGVVHSFLQKQLQWLELKINKVLPSSSH